MTRSRLLAASVALAALAGLAACTPSSEGSAEVPSDWSRVDFDGGSIALPPGLAADPEPPRPAALLSRGLTVDGRQVGRIDVYRESPPDRRAEPSPAALDDVDCPGAGAFSSEELRPGESGVNVFGSRLTPAGVEIRGDAVVCASFSPGEDALTVQLVVQGPEDVVDQSLWRPLVESVSIDTDS